MRSCGRPRTMATRLVPSPGATAARSVATSAAAGTSARPSSIADDLVRATADVGAAAVRRELAERFPPIDGAPDLVDELLDLHSPRQLVGLAAIMARVEGDLRAAPVLAALRLAVLHAILPASRLTTGPGRTATLRVAAGHVRLPRFRHVAGTQPVGRVRGRLPDGPRVRAGTRGRSARRRCRRGSARTFAASGRGPRPRCSGSPVRAASGHSGWTAGIRVAAAARASVSCSPSRRSGLRSTGWRPRTTARRGCSGARPRCSSRPERWRAPRCGHRGAGRPRRSAEPSSRSRPRWPATAAPCSWSTAVRRRSSSAVLGGSSAGFRLVTAQLADADDDTGLVELLPPNAVLPPGPRTRANVALPPVPGGAGDPDLVPGPGLFAAPERFDQRPFSALEASRKVSETAVEMLKARGEPARYERLLPEILVGLDRGGMLRRYTTTASSERRGASPRRTRRRAKHANPEPASTGPSGDSPEDASADRVTEPGSRTAPVTHRVAQTAGDEAPDPVERLIALIDGELARPTQHRLVEIEPGRWWLGDRARPRSGRRASRGSRRMVRVQPAVDGRPAARIRVLRADRRHVHGARPGRRSARPRLPRQLPEPCQHPRAHRHHGRPAAAQPGAHRAARRARRWRPPARDAGLARAP